ncbi:MAG: hypothetical protein M3320_00585 [Actinomycetota bacterium]|nr:hypothetical protein [Actinomycetota bacterium]
MKHATLLISALLAVSLAPPAAAQTATIDDPAEDGTLTGVDVAYDGRLRLSVVHTARPGDGAALDLVVSARARDVHDPNDPSCGGAQAFAITGDGRAAELTADGAAPVRAVAVWEGATATYVFDAPGLAAERMVCVAGTADGDDFFGPFAGKTLFVTPASARAAVLDHLAQRYGAEHRGTARCPSRGVGGGSAFCAFRLRRPRTYRMGSANVSIERGVVSVTLLQNRVFPNALRFCGASVAPGRWSQPPTFGFSIYAWARGVSCRTARRLADSSRERFGFRCRTTSSTRARTVVRCTKRGGRLVRIEAAE